MVAFCKWSYFGHILTICPQKWSYFGHILLVFWSYWGHILRVHLVIFWKNLTGNPVNIFWPDWITNKELWSITNQKPIDEEIRQRKWKWLGHTMRKDPNSITRQSLRWNPAGKRSRGRPKRTWRRTVEEEMKQADLSWGQLSTIAQNRVRWRSTVAAVCASAGAMRN